VRLQKGLDAENKKQFNKKISRMFFLSTKLFLHSFSRFDFISRTYQPSNKLPSTQPDETFELKGGDGAKMNERAVKLRFGGLGLG
jgi:hypothetical protein